MHATRPGNYFIYLTKVSCLPNTQAAGCVIKHPIHSSLCSPRSNSLLQRRNVSWSILNHTMWHQSTNFPVGTSAICCIPCQSIYSLIAIHCMHTLPGILHGSNVSGWNVIVQKTPLWLVWPTASERPIRTPRELVLEYPNFLHSGKEFQRLPGPSFKTVATLYPSLFLFHCDFVQFEVLFLLPQAVKFQLKGPVVFLSHVSILKSYIHERWHVFLDRCICHIDFKSLT